MERDSLAGQFDEVLRPYVEAAKATEVREALLDSMSRGRKGSSSVLVSGSADKLVQS